MNAFLMLLKAAEYVDSRNPDVIVSEHDYASSHQFFTRPPRDSNPDQQLTDRRDRLRPRRPATVKRPGHPGQPQLLNSKKLRRDEDYQPRSDVNERRRSSSYYTNASMRSTHNQLEKNRRHYMRSCFDQLKETIFITLNDQRQRGKSRSLSPLSSSLHPSASSSHSSSSSSSSSCLSASSGSRASSQQILNMAHNLIKDLDEEWKLLEEERWVVMKSNTSLKRRLIGFHCIPQKVTRSRSTETNCSSGRSSYNSSPEFIDVISDSHSMSSEDSGFGFSVSPK